MFKWLTTALCLGVITGCTSLPKGVTPVDHFDTQRYLGQWYEIARLDHRFEKGLSHVTATYSLREDGGLKVINRGYSRDKQQWQAATGKAYFVKSTDQGYLKVSFFGPFYGTYAILALDHNYQYALVTGPNKSYLWILSRTRTLTEPVRQQLVHQAKSLGYATDQLIWVDQSQPEPQVDK